MLIKAFEGALNIKAILSLYITKRETEVKTSWWKSPIKKKEYQLVVQYISGADGGNYKYTSTSDNYDFLVRESKSIISQVRGYDPELVSQAFEEALSQAE